MKFTIEAWTVLELYKRRHQIQFPVYQRGEVWSEHKRMLLIDSILRGIDIPKLYFQRTSPEEWDCIDGHQRIQSIVGFFDAEFEWEGDTFDKLSDEQRNTIEEYKLTITEVSEIDEEEVRLLFQRLQLGLPLNAGEKLNSILSNMGLFVQKMTEHPFIKLISIPTRRFAKEQVCAQICNNSSYINKTQEYVNSKYEDLEGLYRAYKDFDLDSYEAQQIVKVLDNLHSIFSNKASEITNRASVVSIYLLVEEMIMEDILVDSDIIRDFYIKFLNCLREEARAGIDATNRFLLTYHSRIIQAADAKSSIGYRQLKLRDALSYYLDNEQIIGYW